jgi:hypothetical protein
MTLAGDRIGDPPPAPVQAGGGTCPSSRKRRAVSWLAIAVLILLGACFASGFYVVGPDQRAVVRRFGAVADQVGPGMHYRVPWPIDHRHRQDHERHESRRRIRFAVRRWRDAAGPGAPDR